jgi:predicted dehydrogenase
VNYDLWLGPAPVAPLTRPQFHYDWHWQWPYGNGDLGNQGIHHMDIARWGLGVNELCRGVLSYGGRFGYDDAGDTANTHVVVYDYGEAALVFEVRGLNTDAYQDAKVGVIFEGTEGYLVMASYSGGAAFDLDGKKVTEFQGGGDHFENFVKAVRSRKAGDLNANALEGHLSSALCHLGNVAYRLGEPVTAADLARRLDGLATTDNAKDTLERTLAHLRANKLDIDKLPITLGPHLEFDPKTETFPGNDEANQLLTREYRQPFVVPPAGQV